MSARSPGVRDFFVERLISDGASGHRGLRDWRPCLVGQWPCPAYPEGAGLTGEEPRPSAFSQTVRNEPGPRARSAISRLTKPGGSLGEPADIERFFGDVTENQRRDLRATEVFEGLSSRHCMLGHCDSTFLSFSEHKLHSSFVQFCFFSSYSLCNNGSGCVYAR